MRYFSHRTHTEAENYNVYRDSNGFAYDVIITKVAPMENKNERWAITVSIE